MANPESNNSSPSPENSNSGFSIEIRNIDKIYNLLKNKQFQQQYLVEDNNHHCFDVIGEIVPADDLSKVIHVELRGLGDNIYYYQDYNLHLSVYRQVRVGNDDRYDNQIDENKRYFTENKANKLIDKLISFGMVCRYAKDGDYRYIEIENSGQSYIFSCGPSNLEEALLSSNNSKYSLIKYKNIEDFINSKSNYLPWFAFYIKNKDITSQYLYDQYIILKTKSDFEETINKFSKTSEILIKSLYNIYNKNPPHEKLILDYPDPSYNGKGPVGQRRIGKILESKTEKKQLISLIESEIKSESEGLKTSEKSDYFFNKKSTVEEVTFDSIAGQAKAVAEAKKLVLAINHPEVYEKRGVKTPKGILFYGLPGTGKTLIAKAIAHEVNAELFEVSFSDIASKWYGESEKMIQLVFDNANKFTKTGKKVVILLDELDSIAPSRNDSYEGSKKIVSIMLQNLDGFRSNKNVIIIGTTNRPEDIDPALKRPGRIDKIIPVDLPDLEDRKAIIQLHINKAIERSTEFHDLFSKDLDIDKIAQSTDGMSGADLANIINLTLETKTVSELEGIRWTPISSADIERTLVEFNLKKKEKNRIGFNN